MPLQVKCEMPPFTDSLTPGHAGSVTDTADNTVLVFVCNPDDNGATVVRSLAGAHVEYGKVREICSVDWQPEAKIPRNGTYVLRYRGPKGVAMEITLTHYSGKAIHATHADLSDRPPAPPAEQRSK